MTTFEITIIVLLVAIVMLLAWHCTLTRNNYSLNQTKELKRQQDFERLLRKLQSILDICNQQQNAWACDITSIVKHLNELTDIVDKMHRNLCVEITDKMVDKVYPPTYVTPCYAPNGICTNPQMDCINCPKRDIGGSWSTSTNLNKED
jgi:hypothetical protein